MRTNVSCIWLPCFALTLVLAVSLARADNARPFVLDLARPAMDSQGLYTLEASQVLPPWEPRLGLVLSYTRDPLRLSSGASHLRVKDLMTGRLQGAIGLPAGFELGMGLPFSFLSGTVGGDSVGPNTPRLSAQGITDPDLSLKWRVLDTSRHPVGLALVVTATMPVGDPESFLGQGLVTLQPRLVMDTSLAQGRLLLALNLGARLELGRRQLADDPRCKTQCEDGAPLEGGHALRWGVGASWDLIPGRLGAFAEVGGQLGLEEMFNTSRLTSAHEVSAGVKLYLAARSYLLLGAGRGLHLANENHPMGSPTVRIFGGFIFEPAMGDRDGDRIADDVDSCPSQPEDFDDFEDEDGCPDLDNDKDRILDKDDKCPNEPEDKDGFEDEDGCPEANDMDRDGDGIPDSRDKCPDEPEDKDGFEDKDGCPDLDNDNDRILDTDDLCPNRPEDKDGFEDKDGCPDLDNDNDRILDKDDKCPMEPENYNGYLDEDGCPDPNIVRRSRGKLLVLKEIYFETNRAVIKKESFPVVDAVAQALRDHGDISLLEVQGHADERGSEAHNLRLTKARARAVYLALIARGIKAKRLRHRGYGESKPIDPGHTPKAWSINRRVEFVVVKRR